MIDRYGRILIGALMLMLTVPTSVLAKAKEDVDLIQAIKNVDVEAVSALLDQGVDVNERSVDGSSALHWAVYRNNPVLTKLLLDAGADEMFGNRYGVQPLSLASLNGNVEILELLLESGADPNTSVGGGETALMTASRAGNPDVVRALVRYGADVNASDEINGQTALMWAAAEGDAETIHVLAEVGGDVNARTANDPGPPPRRGLFASPQPTGFSPIIFAARAGHIDAVRVLLEAGANVNDTLSDGQNVLVVATANANWEMADYLLDRGADPNMAGAGWNALHQTVRSRRMNIGFGVPGPISAGTVDSINVIRKMIANGVDINARMTTNGMRDGQRNRLNRLGATPFFLAAKVTDVEAMQVLADAGADATIPSAEYTTPLMVAAGLDIWNPGEDGGSLPGQEDEVLAAVTMCVELGNNVNAVNDLDETALHGAAFRGANNVVEYLVEQGAKLDAREVNGWIPWAIANGFSYSDFYKAQKHTAELLASYMSDQGLSTEGEEVPGSICFDCLQTRLDQARAVRERDARMEAEFAEEYLKDQQ